MAVNGRPRYSDRAPEQLSGEVQSSASSDSDFKNRALHITSRVVVIIDIFPKPPRALRVLPRSALAGQARLFAELETPGRVRRLRIPIANLLGILAQTAVLRGKPWLLAIWPLSPIFKGNSRPVRGGPSRRCCEGSRGYW